MRGFGVAISVLLCSLLWTVPSWATTRYVATTGSDSNSCAASATITTPKATFASAIPCMVAGDTLYIRAGTYSQTMNVATLTSGTANTRYTISGYPGETVTLMDVSHNFPITGLFHTPVNYITFAHFILDGVNSLNTYPTVASQYWTISSGQVSSQNHDITIDSVEIKNWFGIGLSVVSDNFTVRNCHIHHQRGVDANGFRNYGIYYSFSNNGLFENNEIDNNPGGGVQLYPGPITNLVVRNNSVHDNDSLSLAAFGGILLQGNDAGAGLITNALIYNNLIYRNSVANTTNPGAGLLISTFTSATKVWDNTIYGNQGYGLQIGYDASTINTVAQNNIVYSNVLSNYLNQGSGTIQDHNLIGTNPSFVNAAAFDFHLQSGSPAINAGATIATVTTDLEGVVRPQGSAYDIGAYEFAGGDITPPTAPSSLVATAVSGTQINLAWTASTDNVGVTNYLVEQCQGASCVNFAQIGTSVGTTFSDTGLTTTVTYRYRVRATDAAANLSGYSNTATATTLDTIAPTSPSGLVATAASSSQINLSWTGSTDNVAVTAYLVERCLGAACGGFVQITSTTNLSLIDTGLAASSIYRYRVRATDAANNLSGYSAIAQATTLATDVTPPTVPTNLHFVSHTNSSITMAWTASTDNVAVSGYQIFQCQGSSCTPTVQVGTSTTTTFTDSPLPCLASSVSPYTYTVRALDPTGNLSAQSAPLTATVLSCTLAPLPPSNVSLAAIADYSRTQITWTQAGAGPPDTYRMDCGMTSGNPTFSKVVTGITLAAFIKDVLPGQGQWFCVVVATTSNVDSSVSNEVVTDVVGPGFGAWGFSY